MSQPNELTKFLDILGGTGRTVTIEDVNAQSYTVSIAIPVGRQLRLMSLLERALTDGAVQAMFETVQRMAGERPGDQVAALSKMVRALLQSDNVGAVLALMDQMVALVDPKLPSPAQDHFELQEVLRLLVPFVGRLLRGVFTVGQPSQGAAEA